MPQLVNWELLSNPINWIIVVIMLSFGTAILHLVLGDHPQVNAGL
jgi:hypothetical protein